MVDRPSEPTKETLEVFRVARRALDELSASSIGTYIISMAKDVSDVLAVLVLAKEAGLYQPARGSRELIARTTQGPSPAPTTTWFVSGGRWTKSHRRSARP